MNKQDFLAKLRNGLSGLPKEDIEERLMFYSEIIDDRIEEGLCEEAAVSAVGSVEKIVEQTVEGMSFAKIAKERVATKRRLKVWEILFLILGSPVWLSLCFALLAVVLSIYVLLWSAIILLWVVFVSLIGCAIGGMASGMVLVFGDNALSGIAVMGAGIVCIGLSVFAFYICKSTSKALLKLTKKFAIWIKKRFVKKGVA